MMGKKEKSNSLKKKKQPNVNEKQVRSSTHPYPTLKIFLNPSQQSMVRKKEKQQQEKKKREKSETTVHFRY